MNTLKCQYCGQFISYADFENKLAEHYMVTPDSHLSVEEYETYHTRCVPNRGEYQPVNIDHILHRGLNCNRLHNDGNVLERKFAENFSQRVENGQIDYILRHGGPSYTPPATAEEIVIACTVIQWLGTHVGQAFLREVANTESM